MKCQYSEKQIKRFWSHVLVQGPNDCWPWLKSKHNKGYGQLGLTIGPKGNRSFRMHKAHKVAYEITNDVMLELGAHGLHKCDVRSCCNPKHIYIGTNADNIRDRDKRNRQARGETQGSSKLKEHDVLRIKLRLDDFSNKVLGLMHNVHPCTINSIRVGKSWAWL